MNKITHEKFWQVKIYTPKDNSIILEQFFLTSGAIGHHELIYDINKKSDFTTLFFFFDEKFPIQAFMPMALAVMNLSQLEYTIEQTKYEDYIKVFEETFKSFELTSKTWLLPSWDMQNPNIPSNKTKIILNPSMAFGTGKHPTSRLMVEYIEKYIQKNDIVVDMGCGSGILSIASLLYGANEVIGIDIAELSVEASKKNILLNKNLLNKKYKFLSGGFDILEKNNDIQQANVFISNILPKIFFANEKYLKHCINNKERWALSGIYENMHNEFLTFLKSIYKEKISFFSIEGWYGYYNS